MKIIFYVFIVIIELILSLGFMILALTTSTVGNRHFYNGHNIGYMFFELGIAFTYTIFWGLINYLFFTQIPWFIARENKIFGYLLKFILILMLIFTAFMINSISYFKQKNKTSHIDVGLIVTSDY